ncbi:TIGR03086 family protein [Kitasatospora sp. NA04385]|uniref:TIGR03086 family metal-binding protein n=1 Tax=Kitasatospora sp. NA04385 TaxID=2742135 RepID=UPI0015907CF4|nr:TIGR03086 family metal-binding protein [Kitasatospora sp. NA04385]QKW20260.1 TIGR03086 family protein [Kitasatospora sp. NA04385]
MASTADPRPGFHAAADTLGGILADLRPDQYDLATPCPDYTVRDLANHVVSVLRRSTAMAGGGPFTAVPHFAVDVPDGGWAAAWAEARKGFGAAWDDPAVLGRTIALPWGPVPGAAAAVIWTNELVLHGWDLAQATGQAVDWPAEALAAPLAAMERAVPAEPRGGRVPYGPVVPVPADAPGIDRLAGWYGRRP